MVLPGLFFVGARFAELFFLIPIIGMLSYLVHGYQTANQLTPNYVLVLFTVSVLAGVWCLLTVIFFLMARHNAYFLAFIDFCFIFAFIAGVAVLRDITSTSCTDLGSDVRISIYIESGVFVNDFGNFCNILKGCFGLSILEILLFIWSVLMALWVHHKHRNDDRDPRYREEKYVRRSHRSSGGNRDGRSDYVSRSGTGRAPPPRSRSRGNGNGNGSYV